MAAVSLLTAAAVIATGAAIMNTDPKPVDRQTRDREGVEELWRREFGDIGQSLIAQQANDQTFGGGVNEAWKPRTAPRREATNEVTDVIDSEARSISYLHVHAPDFYIRADPQVPLARSEQNRIVVQIPTAYSSFAGDPGSSLTEFARVYPIDYHAGPADSYFFSGPRDTLGAGMPTETEVPEVPEMGYVNRLNNPLVGGGYVSNILNSYNQLVTKSKGADRASILTP